MSCTDGITQRLVDHREAIAHRRAFQTLSAKSNAVPPG